MEKDDVYFNPARTRQQARAALKLAQELNDAHTIPVKIDSHTIVFVTPQQYNDKKFIARLWHRYDKKFW